MDIGKIKFILRVKWWVLINTVVQYNQSAPFAWYSAIAAIMRLTLSFSLLGISKRWKNRPWNVFVSRYSSHTLSKTSTGMPFSVHTFFLFPITTLATTASLKSNFCRSLSAFSYGVNAFELTCPLPNLYLTCTRCSSPVGVRNSSTALQMFQRLFSFGVGLGCGWSLQLTCVATLQLCQRCHVPLL